MIDITSYIYGGKGFRIKLMHFIIEKNIDIGGYSFKSMQGFSTDALVYMIIEKQENLKKLTEKEIAYFKKGLMI